MGARPAHKLAGAAMFGFDHLFGLALAAWKKLECHALLLEFFE
jgi:hypothetical protein